MASFSTRGLRSACAISAVAVSALIAPGIAAAKKAPPPPQCSGAEAIEGAGSSLQNLAHVNVWIPEFNASANPLSCNGTNGSGGKPKVTYRQPAPGSVAGMEEWGFNGKPFKTSVNFVGTDEPPNSGQKAEMEAAAGNTAIQTIPVLQGAVAVLVHLPTGCTATSTPAGGRLVVTNSALEQAFAGKINTWKELDTASGNGDKLSSEACEAEAFGRFVRLDGSGTTHIFKKYLGLIDTAKFEVEGGASKNWSEISEEPNNQLWPVAANVKRPAKTGGGEEVSAVANTANTIGYANLADARNNAAHKFTTAGGKGTETFWVEVENAPAKGKKGPKFADPSTDGETSATATQANCAAEKYTNGAGTKFPPKTTVLPWNEVTTATTQTNYTLCGLTYDLALSGYAKAGESTAVATTVRNYLQFDLAVGAGGGQTLIDANHDYLELEKKLLKLAEKGSELVS
jgi:ABC-type phosphate transport system substrate-binding protein